MTTTIRYTSADLEALPDDGRRYEIIDGELEPRFQLLKFDVASRQLWRVIGGLIVVTEQVIEIVLPSARQLD